MPKRGACRVKLFCEPRRKGLLGRFDGQARSDVEFLICLWRAYARLARLRRVIFGYVQQLVYCVLW